MTVKEKLDIKLTAEKKKLLEYMGKPYTTKIIDYENCVYLDLGDYDIEVSSICMQFVIYVWKKKRGLEILETHYSAKKDLEGTKAILKRIEEKYSKK